MKRRKVYVTVEAKFSAAGELLPVWLEWEDGRRFAIDKVLEHRPAASLKVGGAGERYSCMICGEPRFLFYEGKRWFVEAKQG